MLRRRHLLWRTVCSARTPQPWCGGASLRSHSSFDARRIRSSSPNLSRSSGVTRTRGGFAGAGGGVSESMTVIVSDLNVGLGFAVAAPRTAKTNNPAVWDR